MLTPDEFEVACENELSFLISAKERLLLSKEKTVEYMDNLNEAIEKLSRFIILFDLL